MSEKPYNPTNFVSLQVYDAIYKTQAGEQHILLENRQKMDRTASVYTRIEGREIRANSIIDLVLSQPDCVSITISHIVPIVWNTITRQAILEEIISRYPDHPLKFAVRTRLSLDEVTYETTECEYFTEAILELYEQLHPQVDWYLKTCFDCKFSRPAFLWPTSDRDELRCYRDVPEAFAEIQEKSKFASHRYAGDYFVNAFHRCSAWEKIPRRK